MPRPRYSKASYHRLYDPGAGPLWSPEAGLPPEADGDHYRPERDFFEWWYFDAAFESGQRLVAILHSSLFNAVDHKPTVDLRVTPPNGASTVAIGRYDRADYRAAADRCDVRIGSCRAVAEDVGRYRLRLRQGEIAADLLYRSSLPGWQPGTGYLFADDATGHFFRWVVPLPRARVTGTLTANGRTAAVEGIGYHDHNWGNVVLADVFSHWYWGRSFAESGETVIFGDLVGHGPDPAHVRPFLLAVGDEMLPGEPEVMVQTKESIAESSTGVSYPSRLEVSASAQGYRAALSLRADRVVEAVDFARSPFRRRWLRRAAETAFYLSMDKAVLGPLAHRLLGKGSYLRLTGRARAIVRTSQERRFDGHALFEMMQL